MKKFVLILTLLVLLTKYVGIYSQENDFYDKSVKKIWESEKVFLTPESLMFDKKNNVLYVSNINGNSAQKDGNGFISKLSLDGKIIKLKWIEGLNAPKGMGIYNNTLYVADIDRLVVIDIDKSKISDTITVANAQFLNDIAIDKTGKVYVSDMRANKIYQYSEKKIKLWLDSDKLKKPNGLLIEGENLLIGCGNYVLTVNKKNKASNILISETGSIDGLAKFDKESYIISDWSGNVTLINKDKNIEHKKLISTEFINVNAADFEFINDKKTIYIPTFLDNRVVAYKIE
ncbi:MAG: hypothetical protein JXR51_10595 [Bacteroidales bacterium]|nr:hypothetical protein [Bacteroidales bacterium]MBN2757615.1 hypothetical protein [Bacteroidales bacterium]